MRVGGKALFYLGDFMIIRQRRCQIYNPMNVSNVEAEMSTNCDLFLKKKTNFDLDCNETKIRR